ncbi:MAG: DUF4402 domain-containing protein [Gemmatimonadales bacterium]|nr:DUF4402 domain-containing protein [Gemmatimonadales bacterium]
MTVPARTRRGCLAAALALATSGPLDAQVTQRANLEFGSIISGTTTSVGPAETGAASWRIHFTLLALVPSFDLTLPASLSRVGGGATMPISFCATCGLYRANNTTPGGTTFNPNGSVSLGLISLGTNIYVWLGGSVSPPLSQMAGSYTGTMVLTVYGVTL